MYNETMILKDLLHAQNNISQLTNIIKKIKLDAIKQYKNRLLESEHFVNLDEVDLLTECRGDDGIRRYSHKDSEEGAVMLPDSDGFWMPYNERNKL